jgi:hypothetical protein
MTDPLLTIAALNASSAEAEELRTGVFRGVSILESGNIFENGCIFGSLDYLNRR